MEIHQHNSSQQTKMNKYLAFFSFAALCFCLTEAATRGELERLIQQASHHARAEGGAAIRAASRDTLIRATTPQQRACATSKLGPANRELNLALNNAHAAVQAKYRNLTPQQLQEIDVQELSEEINQEFASAAASARRWVDQINNCA